MHEFFVFLKTLFIIIFSNLIFFSLVHYYPEVEFYIQRNIDSLTPQLVNSEKSLVIASANINTPIHHGVSFTVLDKLPGVWHSEATASPGEGGNVVLAGHRFRYLPPNYSTLFHLNKVKESDLVVIHWNGKTYKYIINIVFKVLEHETWITEPPEDKSEILTIYTCTYNSKERIVIRGHAAN